MRNACSGILLSPVRKTNPVIDAVTCQAICQTGVRGHVVMSLVRLSVKCVCVGTLRYHLLGCLSDGCMWLCCTVTCQAVSQMDVC